MLGVMILLRSFDNVYTARTPVQPGLFSYSILRRAPRFSVDFDCLNLVQPGTNLETLQSDNQGKGIEGFFSPFLWLAKMSRKGL
jgi:hypothetical protein